MTPPEPHAQHGENGHPGPRTNEAIAPQPGSGSDYRPILSEFAQAD
jgi:hypothetical protein